MEVLVIKIMSVVIAALVGMFITKIFSDKKVKSLDDKLDGMEHLMIRVDTKLEDVAVLKKEVEALYERMREIETRIAVVESKSK